MGNRQRLGKREVHFHIKEKLGNERERQTGEVRELQPCSIHEDSRIFQEECKTLKSHEMVVSLEPSLDISWGWERKSKIYHEEKRVEDVEYKAI